VSACLHHQAVAERLDDHGDRVKALEAKVVEHEKFLNMGRGMLGVTVVASAVSALVSLLNLVRTVGH
jgi:hypothetical protein